MVHDLFVIEVNVFVYMHAFLRADIVSGWSNGFLLRLSNVFLANKLPQTGLHPLSMNILCAPAGYI